MSQSTLPTPGTKKRQGNLVKARPGEGPDGKSVTKKRQASESVRDRCRGLLEDPDYVKALKLRLLIGEAGAVEVWLYRYAYGDPKPDKADQEEEREHFERIRAEVMQAISTGDKGAKILDISIQRASRKLTRVVREPVEERDGNA
jgi:hypothetical protein